MRLTTGMYGVDVKRVQVALLAEGEALPRWGADSDLGDETLQAFTNWHEDFFSSCLDFVDLGYLPEHLVRALLDRFATKQERLFEEFGSYVRDVRKEAWAGAVKGVSPIERIDTVCLHQMACRDSDWQGWERWRKLAIHWVITCGDAAKAYWLHEMDSYLYHGHGWNKRSVGLEIEGWFSGIGVNPRYLWKPKGSNRTPMTPTKEQVEAACAAIRYTVRKIEEMGGKIKYIGAHRQSYATKESDPGGLLWQLVAIPMMEELGLSEAPTLPKGSPIPEDWDPRNKSVPYRS